MTIRFLSDVSNDLVWSDKTRPKVNKKQPTSEKQPCVLTITQHYLHVCFQLGGFKDHNFNLMIRVKNNLQWLTNLIKGCSLRRN